MNEASSKQGLHLERYENVIKYILFSTINREERLLRVGHSSTAASSLTICCTLDKWAVFVCNARQHLNEDIIFYMDMSIENE